MLVEDDEMIRYVCTQLKSWGKYGFQVETEAANGIRALEALEHHEIQVIFTDIQMPFMDGIALMQEVKKRYPDILFVFMSSFHEFEYARAGLRLGAIDYVDKPMTAKKLEYVLERLREQLLKEDKSGIITALSSIVKDLKEENIPFLEKIARYFYENLDQNFTLEQLADYLELNKDYLGRQIKQKTGLNFRTFYHQMKMEYAKPLIKSGQYKVYEIAEMLGYTSAEYFSQQFKEIVGMTPAAYKKSL